jgi:putative DNA primase/helicase
MRSTANDDPMRQKQYKPLDIDKAQANVPTEMEAARQWVVWKLEDRNGKLEKIPYNLHTGRRGDSTDPATWGTFDEAIAAYLRGGYQGIGFAFANGFCGIDLDACSNPITGEMEQWALEIVRAVESYTEVSPSETGLHIFCKGRVPHDEEKGLNRVVRGHKIEVYSKARFFTFSGDVLPGVPADASDRQGEITQIYNWIVEICEVENRAKQRAASSDNKTQPTDRPELADDEILSLLSWAANKDKFNRLWNGDCTDYPMEDRPEGDHSAADLAFCCMVAFYTGDAAQIDRIFRQSKLYREKWERTDYRTDTLNKAIRGTGQYFGSKPKATKQTSQPQGSGAYIPVTKRELYALKDWSKLTDLGKLILLHWNWDADDINTLEAMMAVWGGRKSRSFRAGAFTIGKRLRGLPDNYDGSERAALERFARRRVKKLLATIEATTALRIIRVSKPGGMVNGKNIPKEYVIDHTPFVEATRLTEEILNQKIFDGISIKSPGQAREIAARAVANAHALANASDDIKAAREAKRARKAKVEQQAKDVHAKQIAFEKSLKAQAEELWRAMFEDDYTRVDIKHYFDNRGEYLKELGRKNLHQKGVISTQSKNFVSDDDEPLNIFVEDNLGQVAAEGRAVTDDTPKTDDSANVRSVDDSTIVNTQNADIFTGATPTHTGPAIWHNADFDQPITVTGWGEKDGQRFAITENGCGVPLDEIEFLPVTDEVVTEMFTW